MRNENGMPLNSPRSSLRPQSFPEPCDWLRTANLGAVRETLPRDPQLMEHEPLGLIARDENGVQRRYATTVTGVASRLTVILAPRARLLMWSGRG
jgi:hypothetical protein